MLTNALIADIKKEDRLLAACRAYIELLAETYPRFIIDHTRLIGYCAACGVEGSEHDISGALFILTKVRGLVSRVETQEGKIVYRRTKNNHNGPAVAPEEFAAKLRVPLVGHHFDAELHERLWPTTNVRETYEYFASPEERRPELEALDNLLAGKKKSSEFKRVILNGQGGPFKT